MRSIMSYGSVDVSTDRCELDSHADTNVGGANCILIDDTGEFATVHSFSEEQQPFKNVPIGTVATAWVDPSSGETFVLIFPQTLFFGTRMKHSLICPNQLRSFGVIVDDTPRQFDPSSSHSITIPGHNVVIPLQLSGVISHFSSHSPSDDELENCRRIVMCSDYPWDPHNPSFATQERAVAHTSDVSAVHQHGDCGCGDSGDEGLPSLLPTPAELLSEDQFANRLISAVNIASDDWVGDGTEGYTDGDLFDNLERRVFAMSLVDKESVVTKEVLARRWGISLDTAHRTLRATTQRGVRAFLNPTDRRLSTRLPHLAFPMLRDRKMYTDTLFAKVKSIRSNVCAQDWTDGNGYTLFYPLRSKEEAYTTISRMVHDMRGIPEVIVSDNSGEQSSSKWMSEIRVLRSRHHYTEPFSPWQNRAERDIQELKRGIKRATRRGRSPKRLWDYCGQWVAAIRRLTAHDNPVLDGLTAEEFVHARTPDISAYSMFDWYEPVWFINPAADAAQSRRVLGRWIGVAENVGSSLTYFILPKSCTPVARSSVFPVTQEERLSADFQQELGLLDAAIEQKIGDSRSDNAVFNDLPEIPEVPLDIFDGEEQTTLPLEEESQMPEADDIFSPELFDQYLTAQILLDRGGETQLGTVKRRKRNDNGNPVGISNPNPLLDTREYEVEFPDGSIDVLSTNTIAENLYSQVDQEGNSYAVLAGIVDHRKDNSAVHSDDARVPGTNKLRRTTKGWQLLTEWKDGTSDWLPLADLKESYPVQVAEYAVNNKIATEPAFAWWVPHVLKKRDRIIKTVKKRYWKRTHKYGIELPHSVQDALDIDARTNTDFWRKAIEKEMNNVRIAFKVCEDGVIPVMHKEIRCHLIFDIKSDTLQRKARLVAGGHMTEPPKDSTYSSVVSRDSVRLFFLIAALNDMDVLACDIQNAYLNAPTKEKVWFRGGKEMGPDEGKVIVIVRALYGLKSSGARFRDHLAQTLRDAGFTGCKADPDVWLRPAVKVTGEKVYEYALCYVDDVIFQGLDPKKFMSMLSTVYTLKEGSVKEPDNYLGADIRKHALSGGNMAWALSSDTYVKRAVEEVERELELAGQSLKKKVVTPLASGYRPELDGSPELDERRSSYYASLMGVLRWCIELGRIDIIVEAGLLSRFQACPREGHLEQMFHVFAYLKKYNRSSLVFDWTEPWLDESQFKDCDWKEFYPGAAEAIPSNMPEPRGKSVLTTCFVDADHAGCRLTRRSHSGVLIFVNRAPIIWYSKRQATVESSTFGSESVAMRVAIDLIEGLRYKLRMMGVPIDGSTKVYCDNDTVVKTTTRPESTLKKKHNAINYHRAREAQAAGHIQVTWIDGTENLADALTKVIVGERRHYLLRRILW